MNSDNAGALFVMILAAMGLIILAYIMMPRAAGAMECRARPDRSSYWTWRQIDGRRCWYRGHRVVAKSRLYWPKESRPPVRIIAPAHRAQVLEPEPPECCWPALTEFDRRFIGDQ